MEDERIRVDPVPLITRVDGGGAVSGDQWSGVARVHDGRWSGSSVLHGSGIFLITAAHLLDGFDLVGGEVLFPVSGGTVSRGITAAYTYPGAAFNDAVHHDLGLILLDRAAPEDAVRYSLYRDDDEVGQQTILVGYGAVSGQEAKLSSGENSIDAVGSSLEHLGFKGTMDRQLFFDYDSGLTKDDTLGDLLNQPHLGVGTSEGMIVPGDSGGGMFIQRAGEPPLLAGINSYFTRLDAKITPTTPELGDIGAATRISSYADWLDGITGISRQYGGSESPSPSPSEVPLSVAEGEAVWFLVWLSASLPELSSVDFTTRDSSAVAGYDYIPTSGTLVMEPGEQWAKIMVQTLADYLVEGDEYFELVLSNPQGASFPAGAEELSAQRTITDDITLTAITQMHPDYFPWPWEQA